jgi:putative ABC transport system permease protein
MLKLTLKNLFARKFRLALTGFAVVLGVAFMAGTFVLTDTLGNVFDDLFTNVNEGVDASVRSRQAFDETAGGPGAQVTREPVSESLLPTVEGAEGVTAVEGSVTGYALVVSLKDGEPDKEIQNQAPTIGVSWGPDKALNHAFGGDGEAEHGRRPTADGEVALDEVTAEEAGVTPAAVERCAQEPGDCGGARVQVVFLEHPHTRYDVVGIFKFGTAGNLAGATIAAFDTATAQQVLNREGVFDQISVAGEPGLSEADVARNVRTALRDARELAGIEVLTGAQLSEDQSNEIKSNLGFFNTFLLIFALIALFVGAFLIYNTFSILVAQRARELGLVRALGASGRQVLWSVALEALVTGLIASIIGLALGVLVAIGLQEMLRALDIDLPSGNTVLLPRTIVVSLVVGTLITLVAAIAPARRAARIAPMVALREGAAAPSSGRRRFIFGLVFALAGVAFVGLGLLGAAEGTNAALSVGVGAVLVFIGVAMLSPVIAVPVARFLGWLPSRTRGVAGVLARENAMRNPRRTASTAAALMIGLALISVVSIFSASIKATLQDVIQDDFRAEFVLQSKTGFLPTSPEAAQAVRDALPGTTVAEFRFGNFGLGDETKALLGTSRSLGRVLDVHPEPGALRRFRDDGGMLIYQNAFDDLPESVRRSRELEIRFPTQPRGETTTVPIAGTFEKKDAIGNDFLLPLPLYEANYTDQADVFTAIRLPAGVTMREAERVFEEALRPFPDVELQDQAEFQETTEAQVGQFINLMYLLLALAVIIALLGIMNTLVLSVFERTRELGLLRAVGMLRKQLRSMIRWEAVIVSVFGALLGVVLGVIFGGAIVQALESEGINLAIPVGQLVIWLVAAAAAGLVAGWWPARRAARLDVLTAINAE